MSGRATGMAVVSVVALLAGGSAWHQQAESVRAESTAATAQRAGVVADPPAGAEQALPIPVETILRDIEQIRAAVGNTPLDGTLLDQTDPLGIPAGAADGFRQSLREHVAPGLDAPQDPTTERTATSPAQPASASEQAIFLRSLRRRLDAIAIDLDEIGCLEQADAIRAVNSQLRAR